MPKDCRTISRCLDKTNCLLAPHDVSFVYSDIAGDDFDATLQRYLGFKFYLKP